MKIHKFYGPVLLEEGWVPAPSYLLRRQLVLDSLKNTKKGVLLEVGSGPAVLLYELVNAGWSCTAIEQSETALKIARKLHNFPNGAIIHDKPQPHWEGLFDFLVAMEVLEHIENDKIALMQWKNWIKPGGVLLLSVPAHEKKWNESDVWAGHYRRYERGKLINLLENTGFEILKIECYGFPLSNFIAPVRARFHTKQLKDILDKEPFDHIRRFGSDQSGTSRLKEKQLFPFFDNFLGVSLIKFSLWLQKKFIHTDLGTGYLVQARRMDL